MMEFFLVVMALGMIAVVAELAYVAGEIGKLNREQQQLREDVLAVRKFDDAANLATTVRNYGAVLQELAYARAGIADTRNTVHDIHDLLVEAEDKKQPGPDVNPGFAYGVMPKPAPKKAAKAKRGKP